MKIANFCKREFVTIHAHESLRSAAALMREQHVGALVVIDSAELPRVLSVVIDRDLAIEVLVRDLNVATTRISAIASNSLVAIPAVITRESAERAALSTPPARPVLLPLGYPLTSPAEADWVSHALN